MELIKFFFKDEVPAVGLSRFKEKKDLYKYYEQPKLDFQRRVFKPNYKNNFFLL